MWRWIWRFSRFLCVCVCARAGIPGVAGRLGVPAKTINFLKMGFLFSRVSAIFFLGVFFAFWGCFCALGGSVFLRFFGVFLCFLGVFLFYARQRDFFLGVNFLKVYHTKTGNSRSGLCFWGGVFVLFFFSSSSSALARFFFGGGIGKTGNFRPGHGAGGFVFNCPPRSTGRRRSTLACCARLSAAGPVVN